MKKHTIIFLLIISYLTVILSVFSQEYYHIEKAIFVSKFHNDFSPSFFQDGIIFISDRSVPSFFGAKTEDLTNTYNIFLYDSLSATTSLLSKKLASPGHEGPASYSKKTNELFFTRTQSTPKIFAKDREKGTLGIYISRYQGGNWTDPEPFAFNSNEYNIAHPFISEQGDILFFASDMEGSIGRMDLFYSLRKGNEWSDPIHLGNEINTTRNEVFPYYDANTGNLYFSSDGLQPRIGRLDIYVSSFDGEKCDTSSLLPSPVNSRQDDFGFITKNEKTGFFSSRREKDKDQVFYFSIRIDPQIFENCVSIEKKENCVEVFEELQNVDISLYSYYWKMGDGNVREGHRVTHCYKDTGTYKIQLNVIDKLTEEEHTGVSEYFLTIEPEEWVDIKIPKDILINKPVKISAEGTFFKNRTIVDFYWMVEDEVVNVGKDFSHTFTEIGQQTIHLSVKTKDNETQKEEYFCKTKTVVIK
jgi:hypothetical protein